MEEKTRLLQSAISTANNQGINPRFTNYGEHVAYALACNHQPGEDILQMDIANFSTIQEVYNNRFPELRMWHANTPSALFHALSDRSSEGSWRAVVRLSANGQHHVAVDVRTRYGAAPSVIVMEPAAMHTYMPDYWAFMGEAKSTLPGDVQLAFIEVGAQKSPADCVMFGMGFALGAFQKSELFDNWHNNLHRRGTLEGEQENPEDFCASPDVLLETAGIKRFSGTKLLPPLFYKHTQSRSVLQDLDKDQPGSEEKDVSTSVRDRKSETLGERIREFAVERDERRYSASIETFRATKIRTTLSRMGRRSG
ncbi:YopJ family acetyltransferase [Paracidovorax citrulli]|uniref:YopJ family acetyltransferase n=1 Tax=Paracidovorax citrulli TaxID=80869 RepID=UPI0009E5C190|nr:YopJ family acetyltransferase [Paracidovorax citrulli]QCX10809.1 type III secretion system YopJ family effector XopJ [Paracidovorax citrulli]UEG46217.1 hypothetical protein LKW27_21650 [Paracidovorax citrulli]UMT90505.1 hypothetical protein FRC90_22195 [Paracidovorax citrulli]UMT94542.1 hypothetical protein FRC97_05800 [Paracidovorax citrulli]WIY34674.1 YopJ family acetyltransferase [Paracidovorax citrulli]